MQIRDDSDCYGLLAEWNGRRYLGRLCGTPNFNMREGKSRYYVGCNRGGIRCFPNPLRYLELEVPGLSEITIRVGTGRYLLCIKRKHSLQNEAIDVRGTSEVGFELQIQIFKI